MKGHLLRGVIGTLNDQLDPIRADCWAVAVRPEFGDLSQRRSSSSSSARPAQDRPTRNDDRAAEPRGDAVTSCL
jgi:hypothetical protein